MKRYDNGMNSFADFLFYPEPDMPEEVLREWFTSRMIPYRAADNGRSYVKMGDRWLLVYFKEIIPFRTGGYRYTMYYREEQ
jgi:hypothetical protein